MRFFGNLFAAKKRRITNDSFADERALMEECMIELVFIRKNFERFEDSLANLNPMHSDFEIRVGKFYNSDRDLARRELVNVLVAGTENIALGYADSKNEYVIAKSLLDKMIAQLQALLLRLENRDASYWRKTHYEEKVTKIQSSMNFSAGGDKIMRNLKKNQAATDTFAESNAVIEDCEAWIDGRYEQMDKILQAYIGHVCLYFSSVAARMGGHPVSASTPPAPGSPSNIASNETLVKMHVQVL